MTGEGARVLIADDEADIRRALRRGLELQGLVSEEACDGLEALSRVEAWHPDVVLMDLAMPRMSGLSAIQRIRAWSAVPIIVLSVMGEEDEKVRALDAGADDYLTKPFGIRELSARIRVALRRSTDQPQEDVRTFGDVMLDMSRRLVTVHDEQIHLTPTEYELLKHLAVNEGRVLTHRSLLEHVWGLEYGTEVHYLRPVITSLRKKLGSQLIQTEPGVGYRLRAS